MAPQQPSQALDSAPALDELAGQFAAHRRKLFAIAHRTLGSPWSADDAMQEVWLRLQRADRAAINSLEAWLTTVVSRVCIDMIRQQVSRREDLDCDSTVEAEVAGAPADADPAEAVMRSDDLALAMQVVLDSLGPLERLALVLHDVFALSYDDIAPIVERTPVAARQLASRARARLRTVDVARSANGTRPRSSRSSMRHATETSGSSCNSSTPKSSCAAISPPSNSPPQEPTTARRSWPRTSVEPTR